MAEPPNKRRKEEPPKEPRLREVQAPPESSRKLPSPKEAAGTIEISGKDHADLESIIEGIGHDNLPEHLKAFCDEQVMVSGYSAQRQSRRWHPRCVLYLSSSKLRDFFLPSVLSVSLSFFFRQFLSFVLYLFSFQFSFFFLAFFPFPFFLPKLPIRRSCSITLHMPASHTECVP